MRWRHAIAAAALALGASHVRGRVVLLEYAGAATESSAAADAHVPSAGAAVAD